MFPTTNLSAAARAYLIKIFIQINTWYFIYSLAVYCLLLFLLSPTRLDVPLSICQKQQRVTLLISENDDNLYVKDPLYIIVL